MITTNTFCRSLSATALLLLIAIPAMAQTSALRQAIAEAGTMHGASDEIAARAIYVKLRPGQAKGDAPATMRRLAERAGLEVRATSSLAFSTVPLAPEVAGRIQSMSPARRAEVARAEEDMSRIVEIYYGSPVDPLSAARLISRLPEVEYAEPVYLPRTFAPAFIPNDPRLPQQPHLEQIRALDAWDLWKGDTSVTIGIVDDGVDQTHEDLRDNIAPNPGESGLDASGSRRETNGIDDDLNGLVDDWKGANLTSDDDGTAPGNTKNGQHGTAVAGLAAATTNNAVGIASPAYLCRFFPVKAARLGSGTISEGYNGIIYCARRGFQVVNVSWGGSTFSQTQNNIITNLISAYDIAIVASAGNDLLYDVRYPSGYPGVLGVSAVDAQGNLGTSWGEGVDVAAPVGLCTIDGDRYDFAPVATSFSSPVAAGALGLVRSRYPELSAVQAIAHLRLTADTIESLNPAEKFRLGGYGRVNVFRAVSVDPFSHPALVVDSVWLTDENGVARNGFSVGERGIIRFRVKNILGDAISPSIGVVTYRDDSTGVTISTDRARLDSLPGGSSAIPAAGIPFTVRASMGDRLRLRFEFTADGGYDDYQYERVLVYRPYITVRTPKLTVSLTDRAQIGYSDYPDQTLGEGFQYEGTPLLYEAGFILATDSAHVVSNVRSANSSFQQMDFVSVETPALANELTVTVNDAAAEPSRRIGLELKTRIVTETGIDNAVGIDLRVRNISGRPIDSLLVTMFQDWDLSQRDQLSFVETPEKSIPFYGWVAGNNGLNVVTGVKDQFRVLAQASGANQYPAIFTAITNNGAPINIFDGFALDEKWQAVANRISNRTAGPADVSMVIGASIGGLAVNEEKRIMFIVAAGPNQDLNVAAINEFDQPSGVAGNESASALLSAPHPNPTGDWTSLVVTNPGNGATLHLYDSYGRLALDLTGQLGFIGEPTTTWISTRALPAGLYHLRLAGMNVNASQTVVVVR